MQLVIVNGVIKSIHLVTLKGVYEKNNYPLEPREEMPIGSGLWYACRLALQKKMLFTVILLTNVLIASFARQSSGLLSSFDSCHVQPPQQSRTDTFGCEKYFTPLL